MRVLVLFASLLLLTDRQAEAKRGACDAVAAGQVRSAIAAACPCDGFGSHTKYVGCTRDAITGAVRSGALPSACRASLRRLFRTSTCSFQRARTTCCEHRPNGTSRCAVRSAARCAGARAGSSPSCNFTPFCSDADCAGGGLGRSELLYGGEGNRLRRYDIDSIKQPPLRDEIFIHGAGDQPPGRDINALICTAPDGSGRFIAGEDTGQPHPPAGWGVFAADGTEVGKLTPTYQPADDQPENFGCAFDQAGRLFLTDVGNEAFGPATGQLIMFFPPYDRFPGARARFPTPTRRATTSASSRPTSPRLRAWRSTSRIGSTSPRRGTVRRVSRSRRRFPPRPMPPAAAARSMRWARRSPTASSARRSSDPAHVEHADRHRARAQRQLVRRSVLTGTIAEFTPAAFRPARAAAAGEPCRPRPAIRRASRSIPMATCTSPTSP